MVRTFLCHPFTEPKAFTDQYEPNALCYTSDDRVVLGCTNGFVHIHNLKRIGCPQLYKFTCVGIPVKLLHCDNLQFIISLEAKIQEYKVGTPANMTSCHARVYFNYYKSLNNKIPTPINNGYSTNVRLNNCGKYINNFVAIDLNPGQTATDMALCPVNNNIAISSGKRINIFAVKKVSFDIDGVAKEIIDFYRIIEVVVTFSIERVILCGNLVTVAARRELRVLQLFLSQPEDNSVYQAEDVSELLDSCSIGEEAASPLEKSSSRPEQNMVNESIKLDNEFVVWNFNQHNNVSVASLSPDRRRTFLRNGSDQFELDADKNVINFQSIREEIPYIDRNATTKEIIGPVEDLIGHPLSCSVVYTGMYPGSSQYYRTVSCVTLLYRRFLANEMSNLGDTDALHSFQWLPVFIEGQTSNVDNEVTELWPWNMFDYSSKESFLSIALFFSTGKEGFLYDINGGSLQQAASYRYTSDCYAAYHTHSLLYAVNKNGLDAYTARLYPLAAEHYSVSFKREDIADMSFQQHKANHVHNSKKQTDTDIFTEMNYFGSYVAISADGSSDPDKINSTDVVNGLANIPVYSPHSMIQPCPRLDLDVCLVGMYLLQHIQMVGCSTSYTVMLVKADKNKDKQPTSSITPWSVYVLEKVPVIDFYNEIMALIEGNELSNPTIYHQLSSEAHLLLRSELISGSPEEVEVKVLVKQSALRIADFLSRCSENLSLNNLIPRYYGMSDLDFQGVMWRFYDQDLPKEKKFLFGPSFLDYVKSVIFGNDDLSLEKKYSEFILKIFLKNQPAYLSEVILNSNLQSFSDELALKFICKYKKKLEAKGRQTTPFDDLCIAVLHMNIGNLAQVEEILKGLPPDVLQKLCLQNSNLLFNDVHSITPFGHIIKKRFKSTFTSILISLFDSSKLTLQKMMEIFKKKDNTTSFSNHACRVCETLLNNASHKKSFSNIMNVLIDQYIVRLVQISKGISAEGWKNNHIHVPKGNGHFSPRFSWLDKMSPFTGEPPSPQDCVTNKSPKKTRNEGFSSSRLAPKSLPNTSSIRNSPSSNLSSLPKTKLTKKDERIYCPCCCCSEVLLKFQSLLCSRYCHKELANRVLNKLTDVSFVGKESLMALCWPKAGSSQEAVEYMVRNYPESTLQYAKEMFDWKAQWDVLLQHLLTILKSNDYEPWNHDAYINVLKGVLLRLTKVYKPTEFLSFLPSDGSMQFFLPYLHECWEYNKSSSLKQKFMETYKEAHKEEEQGT